MFALPALELAEAVGVEVAIGAGAVGGLVPESVVAQAPLCFPWAASDADPVAGDRAAEFEDAVSAALVSVVLDGRADGLAALLVSVDDLAHGGVARPPVPVVDELGQLEDAPLVLG